MRELPAVFLLFRLDDLQCAIGVDPIVEAVRAVQLRTIPGQPACVAGVIDYRGAIVPVLDMRERFGLASKPLALSDNFIIVRIREALVALWVGAVDNLADADPLAYAPRAGLTLGTRSLAGVARVSDGLVMVHDVDAFLAESERDAVAAVSV